MVHLDKGRKLVTQLINQLLSNEGVYRTAPATPGLLNMLPDAAQETFLYWPKGNFKMLYKAHFYIRHKERFHIGYKGFFLYFGIKDSSISDSELFSTGRNFPWYNLSQSYALKLLKYIFFFSLSDCAKV